MTDWSRIIQTVTVPTSACTHRQPIQTSTSSRTKDVFAASQPMLATCCILSQLALAYFALSLPLQTLRPFEVDQQIVVPCCTYHTPITLVFRPRLSQHQDTFRMKWCRTRVSRKSVAFRMSMSILPPTRLKAERSLLGTPFARPLILKGQRKAVLPHRKSQLSQAGVRGNL